MILAYIVATLNFDIHIGGSAADVFSYHAPRFVAVDRGIQVETLFLSSCAGLTRASMLTGGKSRAQHGLPGQTRQ
jgi:hypothetical protein